MPKAKDPKQPSSIEPPMPKTPGGEKYKTWKQTAPTISKQSPVASGLAVVAKDTNRVLLLQRAITEDKDANAGLWELPGGHIKVGEIPFAGAVREWTEETGNKLPEGKVIRDWASPNGVYQGFVYLIPSEKDIDLNLNSETRAVQNPDGDYFESLAFWDVSLLPDNPALRTEMQNMDWNVLKVNKSMKILKQINKIFELQVSSTDPEDVECGSQKPGWHSDPKGKTRGERVCHPIERIHGAVGRPKGARAAEKPAKEEGKAEVKEKERVRGIAKPGLGEPGKPPPVGVMVAAGGFKPPINGKVAAAFAIPDDLGSPLKIPKIPVMDKISAPDEMSEKWVQGIFEILPESVLDTVREVKVEPTTDSKIVTLDEEKQIITIHKVPKPEKGITSEYIKNQIYHNIGHLVWNSMDNKGRQPYVKLYNNASSKSPRAFITEISKLNPMEFHGEAFSFFITSPKFLWLRNAALYRLFYQSMEGQEYRYWRKEVVPGGLRELPGLVPE